MNKTTQPKNRLAVKLGVVAAALLLLATAAFFMTRPTEAATICVNSPIEQRGSHNECVRHLQKMLNGLNSWHHYDNKAVLIADSDFGPLTDSKVRAYQRSMFLVADGEVGPKTWKALCTDALAMFIAGPRSTVSRLTHSAGSDARCDTIVSNYNL